MPDASHRAVPGRFRQRSLEPAQFILDIGLQPLRLDHHAFALRCREHRDHAAVIEQVGEPRFDPVMYVDGRRYIVGPIVPWLEAERSPRAATPETSILRSRRTPIPNHQEPEVPRLPPSPRLASRSASTRRSVGAEYSPDLFGAEFRHSNCGRQLVRRNINTYTRTLRSIRNARKISSASVNSVFLRQLRASWCEADAADLVLADEHQRLTLAHDSLYRRQHFRTDAP